jgi:hypothetical protein
MCSRCTRTHLGSANKAPGVVYLGSLFFSDASTGFPESRRAWLQTKENVARGGLSAGFVLSRGHPPSNPQWERLVGTLVAEAVNHLNVRSCLIDGEVVCYDERGVAAFQLLRHGRNEAQAFLRSGWDHVIDLAEVQEPRRARGEAGGGGGLAMINKRGQKLGTQRGDRRALPL